MNRPRISSELAALLCLAVLSPACSSEAGGDGALNDTFTGDLVYGAERPGLPWISVEFAFDDLAGTLRPTVSGAAGEVYVEFGAEPRGWIAVRHETQDAIAASETWAMAGHWGDVPPPE
jgi:hypothetical protein